MAACTANGAAGISSFGIFKERHRRNAEVFARFQNAGYRFGQVEVMNDLQNDGAYAVQHNRPQEVDQKNG